MARANGSTERRLSTLERLAKEDRVRWRALAAYLKSSEARWQKNDERWQKNDERWQKSDERLEELIRELDRKFDRQQETIDKQQASIDATLKILYRKLEGTP